MKSFGENLQDDFGEITARAEIALRIRFAQDQRARFEAIRDFYIRAWRTIKTRPAHVWAIDPNEVEWLPLFSPIETILWGDIREDGMVLYPQHPVAGYFVDFGHPVARVAIECDGKQFHTDRAADRARQAAIEAKGWRVFRLTGSQCSAPSFDMQDEGDDYAPSRARMVLREIAAEYKLSAKEARRAA